MISYRAGRSSRTGGCFWETPLRRPAPEPELSVSCRALEVPARLLPPRNPPARSIWRWTAPPETATILRHRRFQVRKKANQSASRMTIARPVEAITMASTDGPVRPAGLRLPSRRCDHLSWLAMLGSECRGGDVTVRSVPAIEQRTKWSDVPDRRPPVTQRRHG